MKLKHWHWIQHGMQVPHGMWGWTIIKVESTKIGNPVDGYHTMWECLLGGPGFSERVLVDHHPRRNPTSEDYDPVEEWHTFTGSTYVELRRSGPILDPTEYVGRTWGEYKQAVRELVKLQQTIINPVEEA